MTKYKFNLSNGSAVCVDAADVKTAINVAYMKSKMVDATVGNFEEWFKTVVTVVVGGIL